jgi:hypothetical protein
MRRALVHNISEETLERYLPANYHIEVDFGGGTFFEDGVFLIEGEDDGGWTLDDYVIPRLLSGLYTCQEVEVDDFTYNHLHDYCLASVWPDHLVAFLLFALQLLADDPGLTDYGWTSLLASYERQLATKNLGLSSI